MRRKSVQHRRGRRPRRPADTGLTTSQREGQAPPLRCRCEAVRRFTLKPVHDVGAGLVPARFRLLARPGKRDAEGGVPYGNNVRWYTSEPTGDRKGRPYGNIRDFRIVGTGALDGPFSASLVGAAISRPWTRQHPGSCHCEGRLRPVAIRFLFPGRGEYGLPRRCTPRNDIALRLRVTWVTGG